MTSNPNAALLTTDLFGTYREPQKKGKKAQAKNAKQALIVPLAEDPALNAFRLLSQPLPAPKPLEEPLGVEALGQATDAARLRANDLAYQIVSSEGEMTDTARAALRQWSGEGGLGGSTSAFYTPRAVVDLAWTVSQSLTTASRVLEFSCGGGAFLARAPRGSLLTGIELDETSAKVSQLLFPHASVHQASLETYHRQSEDKPFGLVIGNPPYGVRGATAREDRPQIDQAHWYFVFAGLERLEAGGIMTLVLPEAMFRNPSEQAYREQLIDAAHVLTASVMPESVFKATGAGVTTVLLVLRKHDAGVVEGLAALSAEERAKLRQARLDKNSDLEAFVQGQAVFTLSKDDKWALAHHYTHLGSDYREVRHGRYGDPIFGGDLHLDNAAAMMNAAKSRLNDILTRAGLESAVYTLLGVEARDRFRKAKSQPHAVPEGQLSRCRQYRFQRGRWTYDAPLANPATLSALRVAQALVRARASSRTGLGAAAAREQALSLHEAHQQTYGAYDLAGLGRVAHKLPILNVLVKAEGQMEAALSDLPAPNLTLTAVSLPDMARELEAYGVLCEETLQEHAPHVPPAAIHSVLRADYAFTGQFWEANSTYYRGHAHLKANVAERLAEGASGIRRLALLSQAERLRRDAPWVDVADMTLEPRDPLIPEHVLSEWTNAYLGTKLAIKRNQWDQAGEPTNLVYATRSEQVVSLRLRNSFDATLNLADRQAIPSGRIKAVEAYLNFRTPVDTVVNQELKSVEQITAERSAHQQKAVRFERELAAHFRSFVLQGEYAGVVEQALNEGRYALLAAQTDPRPLILPEYKGPLAHPFQAGHVRTAARMSGLILNFGVGLGKTLTAYMLACLLRQTGRAKLPAFVVPLSRLGDWVMNAAIAVPQMRVLVIGGEPVRDLQGQFVLNDDGEPEVREDDGKARRAKIASLVSDPPDMVIFTAEAFEMMPMLEQTRARFVQTDATLMTGLSSADSFDERHRKLGGHRALVSYERFVQRHLARVKIAEASDIPFEATGIDALLADEVHMFKNVFSAPTVYGESNPKFLGGGGESNRALDANHKFRFVRELGGCTVGLTATYFKNSPIEIYNMLSLVTDDLAKYGVTDIGSFVARFCVIEPRLITLPEGDVEYKPCVVGFRNLDELRSVLSQHVIREMEDTCLMHDRVGMNLPPLVDVEHKFELAPAVQARYDAEQAELANVESEGEKHLFSIFGRLIKLTLHPPLLGVDAPNARFAECVKACVEARGRGGRNLIFMYTGGPDGRTYQDLKAMLVAAGYPEHEIEIVTGNTHKGGERLLVERRFRRGVFTCVIGSSVIEQGGNYQGGTDLHHLDYPHDFEAFVQRIGRCRRQGTTVASINNHLYFALGSFDAIRFQNMLGKKGWSSQVYDPTIRSCENAQVGFDGEELAVMLARDPDAMRQAIRVKKEARAQEARVATLMTDLSIIREYLDSLSLLRARHFTAQGREKGPSTHDVAGINRLVTRLKVLHAQVDALRSGAHPFAAITRLKEAPVWVEGLPMHRGLTFKAEGKAYRVISANSGATTFTAEVDGSRSQAETAVLEKAVDLAPTREEEDYGEEAFLSLPRGLQERIELAEAEIVPANLTMPALPTTLPQAVAAPLKLRYGLSVAASAAPRAAAQVFSIQGDALVAGEVLGAPLVVVEFRAERDVQRVTLVLPDAGKREQTRKLLLAHDPRLRQRVDVLLSTAV